MATDYGNNNPKYIVTLAKGDMISLKSIGLTDEEVRKYTTITSSETEHATISNSMIKAKGKGEATITLKTNNKASDEVLKIKVKVIESGTYISPALDLSLFLMIDDELNERLISLDIGSLDDVIKKFGSKDSRRDNSRKLNISEYEAAVYFHQAALWQIPMMTKEFSYLAALVGVRNAEDLSKVNVIKLQQAFELLKNNILISFRSFDFPDYSVINKLVQSAKDMNSKYYDYYNIDGGLDPVPSSLIDNDGILKSDSEIINEGLKFLENIKPALPLPQTISGYVKVKDTVSTPNKEAKGAGGLIVSISGISNPAEDRTEDEREYTCNTDPKGYFSIDMPDKYNMQETVKITVSKKNDMTYVIAGQNSSHKVEFVKRASEIMQNEYALIGTRRRKAYEILSIINKVRNDNSKAMEIERKLKELAYYKYAKNEKLAELADLQTIIENKRHAIEDEVRYHIRNRKNMIDSLKRQKDDELGKAIDGIIKTFEEDKTIFACLALILGLANATLTEGKTDSDKTSTQISSGPIEVKELSAEQKYEKLVRHSKYYDLDASALDPSKKKVVEEFKECIIKLDELVKAKAEFAEKAAISEYGSELKRDRAIEMAPLRAGSDDNDVDKIKADLMKDVEDLFKQITEFQENYIKEFEENAKKDKFDAIKGYEEKYLPSYSSQVQDYMRKTRRYSAILEAIKANQKIDAKFEADFEETFKKEYDYKKDGICDTLEELRAKCDISAYEEIKDAENIINQIEEEWNRAIVRNNETADASDDDWYKKLDKEHFCNENDVDPYKDIINQLPFGNERCNLLRDKIDTYIQTKTALNEVSAELAFIDKRNDYFEESNKENTYLQTYIQEMESMILERLKDSIDTGKIKTESIDRLPAGEQIEGRKPFVIDGGIQKENKTSEVSELPYELQQYIKYKELIAKCEENLSEIYNLEDIREYSKDDNESDQAYTSSQIERCIINFLSTSFDSEFDEDDFIISQTDFDDNNLHPRVLPSVKLLGDGTKEIYLPTDTAPSRLFNYTMVHRLVEPKIRQNGRVSERAKLNGALKVQEFKSNLYTNPENIVVANTLGIGYSLDMHQAWVPDGFALGNLLYSLVLAPGEEQRLIVREHKEAYTVSDDANAYDTISDSYTNSQLDNETAAFNNAVDRYSSAHSDSSYYSKAESRGGTGIGFFFGIGATSSSTSTNRGSSSANSSQRDSYDEASHAAQSFQTSIKTESERIASARRTSISVATSEETESVSSRIIANHNHSHVMTVQYWEVVRRYRLETCIDGVELLLFVPLELIRFMPGLSVDKEAYSGYTINLTEITISGFTKDKFEYRYRNILKYYDVIERYVPFKYRSGLNLIKRFAAIPYWDPEKISKENQKYSISIKGGFCEFDNLSVTIYFSNGSSPIQGILRQFKPNNLVLEDKTTSGRQKKPHKRKEVIEAILSARENLTSADFSFTLPYGCSKDDISQISIRNNIKTWKYTLSQDKEDMEEWEKDAVINYEDKLVDLYKDSEKSWSDIKKINHYSPGLPECYNNPVVTFSPSELYSLGDLDIQVYSGGVEVKAYSVSENNYSVNSTPSSILATGTLGSYSLNIYIDNSLPKLRLKDIQKIEETFRHIVSDTMYYSQVVWSSLSDNERILLLEPYTIEFDNIDKIASPDCSTANIYKSKKISLINCVNAKKVVGFYGNCMMLPFTFPKELAELLGKTSGDIQDELYRYHACNFRVPSTVISVPTDGMIGEAVLGATNVSEKIDITRFWNWKDSDIDHITIDQSSLNGRSLLENANTKDVDAPTVGVTATEHINGNNLASALIARQQPTFADVYTNTDMREVMKNADNNASAGREQVIQTTSELAKAALDAAVKAGTTAATLGAAGGLEGVASSVLGGSSGGGGAISGILGALGDAGLGDANLGKLLKEGLGENGSLGGIAKSIVGMVGDGESDALKKALGSIGGDELKQFLSNFAGNASGDGSRSLESNFMDSISGLISNPGNIKTSDILNMAKSFCSDNNIELSDVTSFLGKKLGLF